MRSFNLPQLAKRPNVNINGISVQQKNTPISPYSSGYARQRYCPSVTQMQRPILRQPVGMFMLNARQKAQFSVNEKLYFKDKRTNEECYRVTEQSLPSNYRYFFHNIHKSEKPLLCLDMDQTLLFSQVGFIRPSDVQFTVSQGSMRITYSTIYRPHLHEFLREMDKYYDLMIFTSAGQLYADALIDRFDTDLLIKYRVYQQHCTPILDGGLQYFVKDLSRIGQSLNNVILVDDNIKSF